MKIIYRGAESIIYLDEFEGEEVILKERIKKGYRIEQIDKELRKVRTRKEVKLLTEARKVGVLTPRILHVDYVNYKIIMESIAGKRIKELLNEVDEKTITRICLEIGRAIGKLHARGIVHGDLTTSNMILKDDEIYFIDFGLGDFSSRIEDQGVDLNLLYEALRSTHFKILNFCWSRIVEGYKKEYQKAGEVLKKIEEIEKRARYMER
ncbi:MAG: KEOPS complex kinase/ATPase Bud32 [Candidatus Aenigmarchaeota archaeon]|nr:KEOPS complex kinase/ATPase Bud32 [Candidatus Aenigmarchaeota archaeon]